MYTLKKSLGQHFLKDEGVINKIIKALQDTSFKNLLEVGPGGGALTKHLVEIPGINFKAVELDREKIPFLEKNYPTLNGHLINDSFLDIDIPFADPFTVIGNFPYNISTQIVFKILEWNQMVPCAIGMFQKEVGLRIAAKEGSKVYGVISVLVQYYYDAVYLFDVSSQSFNPPPKVESGVIKLTLRQEKHPITSERALWVLVKTAFNQRRKTMRNAVKSLFTTEMLADPLFERRAETLSVKEFCDLTFKMIQGPLNQPGLKEIID